MLDGHDLAEHFNIPDYPSVRLQPDVAAAELDRLTKDGKIHWYEQGRVPSDLDIAPTTLILKSERSRLVHNWTKAGLNKHLSTPSSRSHTRDDLVQHLWKGCHIAGLDKGLFSALGDTSCLSSTPRCPASSDRPTRRILVSAYGTDIRTRH